MLLLACVVSRASAGVSGSRQLHDRNKSRRPRLVGVSLTDTSFHLRRVSTRHPCILQAGAHCGASNLNSWFSNTAIAVPCNTGAPGACEITKKSTQSTTLQAQAGVCVRPESTQVFGGDCVDSRRLLTIACGQDDFVCPGRNSSNATSEIANSSSRRIPLLPTSSTSEIMPILHQLFQSRLLSDVFKAFELGPLRVFRFSSIDRRTQGSILQ